MSLFLSNAENRVILKQEAVMGEMSLSVVPYSEATDLIQAIRQQVFQVEQGVDPELDFDGQDEASVHLLAAIQGKPIATARIRYLSDQLAKIERVAVLADYRGKGIGTAVMEGAIAHLSTQSISQIKVNAQLQAIPFYERLGFIKWGDPFNEAGISHIEMRLNLCLGELTNLI